MRVALVSSGGACGIAEHSDMLKQYVHAADRTIEFVQDPAWLEPGALFGADLTADILHLNYHRGLHSRWIPAVLGSYQGPKVVTFHDTFETQPDRLPWDLLKVCDAMIVHEPCDLQQDPKVRYWRQGVPEPPPTYYDPTAPCSYPVVGSVGFDFPWKGFNLLCAAAESVGWGVHILSNNMTAERIQELRTLNRRVQVTTQFQNRNTIIEALMQCDATAFLYQCANSGTSGAIRLGIAAGKPVIAATDCRQFRDLEGEEDEAILFVEPSLYKVQDRLTHLFLQPFDPAVVALRERDSWRHLGKQYAALYHAVVHRTELPQ